MELLRPYVIARGRLQNCFSSTAGLSLLAWGGI